MEKDGDVAVAQILVLSRLPFQSRSLIIRVVISHVTRSGGPERPSFDAPRRVKLEQFLLRYGEDKGVKQLERQFIGAPGNSIALHDLGGL